ncbi:hypothetical protein EUGRSUZ_G02305 [Eucalyptus grandis]|uniref:Uncharacterized protein n=2 Tax=Eucalyptus grandis TaxID=71139 RepID=A0ACC3K6G7_EUCGR|nr:hypothetical protein EUGRSUZ_G02305 [Eucalyptus grandis]
MQVKPQSVVKTRPSATASFRKLAQRKPVEDRSPIDLILDLRPRGIARASAVRHQTPRRPPAPSLAGREHAAVRHLEGRGATRNVNPGRGGGRRPRHHHRPHGGQQVRRRSEGRDDGVPDERRHGGVPAGVQLGALELLPLLLVRVLVAPQGLRVGEFPAAVLALVLPLAAAPHRDAAFRRARRRGLAASAAAAAVRANSNGVADG